MKNRVRVSGNKIMFSQKPLMKILRNIEQNATIVYKTLDKILYACYASYMNKTTFCYGMFFLGITFSAIKRKQIFNCYRFVIIT